MAERRTHIPDAGNSWSDADRQYFIDTHFGRDVAAARVIKEPGEVLQTLVRLLGENYLVPGWSFTEAVVSGQSYAALVFRNLNKHDVALTSPHPAELLQPNEFGRISNDWHGSTSWAVSETPIDQQLMAAGTNRMCDYRPSVGYNHALMSDREPVYMHTGYQAGTALAIFHFTGIDTQIERTLKEKGKFDDQTRRFDRRNRPDIEKRLQAFDQRVEQLQAAIVASPKPIFP